MHNKITHLVTTSVALTGSYVAYEVSRTLIGSLGAAGSNQVVFHIIAATTGDAITIRPEELYSYTNSSGTEQIGWTPRYEDDGTNLTAIERAITGELVYQYAFPTTADRVRIKVKGSGTVVIYMTGNFVE